jgi:hypothetical protein
MRLWRRGFRGSFREIRRRCDAVLIAFSRFVYADCERASPNFDLCVAGEAMGTDDAGGRRLGRASDGEGRRLSERDGRYVVHANSA